jgi:hypothetical protein
MDKIKQAIQAIKQSDALLIGASNGLSIAEGYHIFADNEMFHIQFGDFQQMYGIRNVIEGCFYQYPNEAMREKFLKRLVQYWVKDYKPSKVMKDLLSIVDNKDYFILTSNADTHLELSGFASDNVFELEGTFEDMLFKRPIQNKNKETNAFLNKYHNKRIVILELGIGSRNRLIKMPLMQLAAQEPQATYITLNLPHEIYIPEEIMHKSIGLEGDIAQTLHKLAVLK